LFCAPDDGRQCYPEHVEQSPDKINSVTCASCWDFYVRILESAHNLHGMW
jgi:hypothetical protein